MCYVMSTALQCTGFVVCLQQLVHLPCLRTRQWCCRQVVRCAAAPALVAELRGDLLHLQLLKSCTVNIQVGAASREVTGVAHRFPVIIIDRVCTQHEKAAMGRLDERLAIVLPPLFNRLPAASNLLGTIG
jgi:hypothetical protein